MLYYNKAIVIGNLTRDPELKSLPTGTKMTTFSVATNRVFKDRDGNRQENTDFHNVVVFGLQAENSARYLQKGRQVMVEGRMQTRSWDDQSTGQKKYRTEIVADRVQFGSSTGSGSSDQSANRSADPVDKQSVDSNSDADQIDYPEEEINPEDIPF